MGYYLALLVHPADIQDRDGARLVLAAAKADPMLARLEKIWADGGYPGALVSWVKEECGWGLEIVKKPAEQIGFVLLPKRWIGERTFAWQCGSRRLTIDYDQNIDYSHAWLLI